MISSQGAAPPQNGKPQTWKQETLEDPDILRIILKPLTTLTAVKEHLTPSKFSNLEAALRDYCEKLLLEGNLTSCELPPNDYLELPTSRYLDSKFKVFSYINYNKNSSYRALSYMGLADAQFLIGSKII